LAVLIIAPLLAAEEATEFGANVVIIELTDNDIADE